MLDDQFKLVHLNKAYEEEYLWDLVQRWRIFLLEDEEVFSENSFSDER